MQAEPRGLGLGLLPTLPPLPRLLPAGGSASDVAVCCSCCCCSCREEVAVLDPAAPAALLLPVALLLRQLLGCQDFGIMLLTAELHSAQQARRKR